MADLLSLTFCRNFPISLFLGYGNFDCSKTGKKEGKNRASLIAKTATFLIIWEFSGRNSARPINRLILHALSFQTDLS